ncbi:uncharacterized protein LOC107610182 [Arachis ipaensis]|uniref:uncharacterized protein LOC107610182 n=1 Tax=Arachis ipaensis TaxID=130454 RepID=UPI000A2B4F23|nr:uncharacterized protein LOC107610182 [Arachis ipaensis]
MELGAAAELLSQRRKGEANVTHGGEEGAAVEPRPFALFVYRRCCSLRVRREEKMLTCTIVPRYLRRAFIIVAPYSRCHQHLLPLPLRVTQQRRSRSSSAAVAGDLGCCCSYGGEKRLHHPLRFDIEPLFLTLIDAAAAVSVALKSPLQLPV